MHHIEPKKSNLISLLAFQLALWQTRAPASRSMNGGPKPNKASMIRTVPIVSIGIMACRHPFPMLYVSASRPSGSMSGCVSVSCGNLIFELVYICGHTGRVTLLQLWFHCEGISPRRLPFAFMFNANINCPSMHLTRDSEARFLTPFLNLPMGCIGTSR